MTSYRRAIFFFSPVPLDDGEQVLWHQAANRLQGQRAVGGRIIVTDKRIIFEPNRFDAATRGLGRDIPLGDIVGVETTPRFSVMAGGLLNPRSMVRLVVGEDDDELLITNDADRVVERISAATGASPGGPSPAAPSTPKGWRNWLLAIVIGLTTIFWTFRALQGAHVAWFFVAFGVLFLSSLTASQKVVRRRASQR